MRPEFTKRLWEFFGTRKGKPEVMPLSGGNLARFIVKARNPQTARIVGEKFAISGTRRADAERTLILSFLSFGVPIETARELTNQRLKYFDEFPGQKPE